MKIRSSTEYKRMLKKLAVLSVIVSFTATLRYENGEDMMIRNGNKKYTG